MVRNIDLVVYPGDGIGPEIVKETVRVLEKASEYTGTRFSYHFVEIGDEVRKKTGTSVPEEGIEMFEKYRVGLKGPVGETVSDFISKFRFQFDLYVNVRPVTSYGSITPPALRGDIDLVVVRENSEGIYRAIENEILPGVWTLSGVFTKRGCERLADYSFRLARKRRAATRKGKITVAHKANVLKNTHGLFVDSFRRAANEYPDVSLELYYADALCAYLVRRPQDFDVIACDNLIGDLVSDLAAEVGGGLGLAGSANLNPERRMGLFEPLHGSAPDIAGKGIADPISQINCAVLMLDFLGTLGNKTCAEASRLIARSVSSYLTTAKKEQLPSHLGGVAKTSDITNLILKNLERIAKKSEER